MFSCATALLPIHQIMGTGYTDCQILSRMEDKDFDVDEALDRLEEINSKLAAGDMSLAESKNLYKEGVELAFDKAMKG